MLYSAENCCFSLMPIVHCFLKCSETSESATYPFNEKCDRKQPLTMKGDTYYAQVVKMIESVKTSTNDFLSEHLQSQKKLRNQAASSDGSKAGGKKAAPDAVPDVAKRAKVDN